MRSFCCKPRIGFLCSLCGLLVAICLISLAGIIPGAVEAQAQPPDDSKAASPPVPVLSALDPPRQVTPPPLRGIAEVTGSAATPAPALINPPREATPQEVIRSRSIDQLLEQLQDLRAKKAELEKQEKEVLAAMKERLKEQKQKLQKLGVQVEEPAPRPPIENAKPDLPRLDGGSTLK